MEITLCGATDEDFQFARLVHHLAYREVVEMQFGPWDEAAQDAFFAKAWAQCAHQMIMADGRPCGYAAIKDGPGFIEIHELVIHPAWQNRGVGSHILQMVIGTADARNVPVRLQTHLCNRAQELYCRHGFKERGRTSTHIRMQRLPNG